MAFVSTIKAYIDAEAMLYSAVMTHRHELYSDPANPPSNAFVNSGYACMIQLSGSGLQFIGSVHDFGFNMSRYASEEASGPETSAPIRLFGDQDVVIATREMIESAYDANLGDDIIGSFFAAGSPGDLVRKYIRGDNTVDVSSYDSSVLAMFITAVTRVLTLDQRTGWEQLAGDVQGRLVDMVKAGSYTVPAFVEGDSTYRVRAEAVSGLVNNWQSYYPKVSPFNWNSYGVAVSITIVSELIIVPDHAKTSYDATAKAGFYPVLSVPQNQYRTGAAASGIGAIQTNIARYVAAGNNSAAILETAKAILRGTMV